MKKTFWAILGVFMFVTSMSFCETSFAEEQAVAKPFEYNIRYGDNLTHIAKQFNTTKEKLFETNKNGRCVKSMDLILAKCKMAIPDLYPTAELIKAVARVEDIHRKTDNLKNVLLVFAGFLLAVLFVVIKVMSNESASDVKNNKQLAAELKEAKGALADQVLMLSDAKKGQSELAEELEKLSVQLGVKEQELNIKEQDLNVRNQQVTALKQFKDDAEQLSNRLLANMNELEIAKAASKNYIELESREHGKIKFQMQAICQECGINIKPQNALSHYFKTHGTTEESKPNGWNE